jgi:hypothetical protein
VRMTLVEVRGDALAEMVLRHRPSLNRKQGSAIDVSRFRRYRTAQSSTDEGDFS